MDENPFAAAAAYYDRFRAPYAPAALDYLVQAGGLNRTARVLDLGCGPGTLAIPLCGHVAEVVAVDREPAMLAEGRRLAAERGCANIRWLRMEAEDLSPALGGFRLATLGQSFHWMDRDRVLARLAERVEAGGALAMVNPGERRPQERWEDVVDAVIARFLGPRDRHAAMNGEPRNEPALLRSPAFSRFTKREFPSEITRDVASILGYAYSTSFAARPRFGDQAASFEAALSEALLAVNPTGVFHERIETEVLIAPKR